MKKLVILCILFTFLTFAFSVVLAQQPQKSYEIPPMERKVDKVDNYKQGVEVAKALLKDGSPGEALKMIMQLKDAYGDNTELNDLLKEAYLAGKEYDKVEELVKKDIERDPKDWKAYCELANVCLKTQREEEAKGYLAKAVDIAPDKITVYQEAASVYLRNGLTSDAIDTYKRARMKLDQPDIFALDLASLYEALKDYKSAIDEYFLFMGNDSTKFNVVENQINNLIQSQENLDQIQAALGERIKRKPQDRYYQKLYGELLFREKDLSGAFETYKKVDKLFDAKGNFILSFAQMCYNTRYFDFAIQASQYLLSANPAQDLMLSAKLLIARSDEGMEKFPEAIAAYQEIIDKYSSLNPVEEKLFHQEIAWSYFEIGEINLFEFRKPDEAFTYYQKVVTNYRDTDAFPPAQIRLSDCLMAKGDLDSAQTLLQAASKNQQAETRQEEIEYKLSEIAFFKGNFEDALTGYNQVIADFPKGFYVNNSLERIITIGDNQELDRYILSLFSSAMLEKLQGKFDSAIIKLDQIINAKSEKLSDLAQLEKGKIYAQEKKFSSSVDAYQKLLEKYPQSLYRDQAQMLIGDVYNYGMKDKVKAIDAYQKLLKDYDRSIYVDEVRDKLKELKGISSSG